MPERPPGPDQRGTEEETEMVSVPPASPPSFDPEPDSPPPRPRSADPPSSSESGSSSELGLIQAARMQAAHRSRPAMRGVGMATGIPGYTYLRDIHRGGQGVVSLYKHDGTGRQVAIKFMREGALARQSERIRFEREIKVLAQLDNPNIVAIHDSGVAGGCGYYVMDYIAGHKLDEYVRDNDVPVEDTLRLFCKVCYAINAAHLRGVIHRDIKPGNIRVTPAGEPHVLDFGLAKLEAVDENLSAAPTQMTETGQFVGSLPWAGPEQVGGPGQVDVRTDVYALGVILYELLTGRFPYDVTGPMPEVVSRILNEMPTRPGAYNKQVNTELDTIVLKTLAKPQDMRYETPGELARDIERFLAGEPIAAKRDNWRYMARKLVLRYWVWFAAAASLLALIIAVVYTTLYHPLKAENETLRGENEALEGRVEALEQRLEAEGIAPP